MPDEVGRFQIRGPSWAERAQLGGLRAVIAPNAKERVNQFFHGVHRYGASRALSHWPERAAVVDFGCGNGRFTRYFMDSGCSVLGTEITAEMLDAARVQCPDASFALTDGIHIPAEDSSLDAVWACGVLRFSLFVDEPVHDQIAAEMFRILRPGGRVINLEMYVDREPLAFTRDFEAAGFTTKTVRVLHRYRGKLERLLTNPRIPDRLMSALGRRCAQLRYHFDDPRRGNDLRDYYFEYEKPR